MLKDVTLGKYYNASSILHRMDPRVKLFALITYLVMVFMCTELLPIVATTVFMVAVILLSRVPVKYMLKSMKPILFLLVITMTFTLLFTKGESLVQFWIINITKEGVRQAGIVFIRLFYIVMGSSVLMLTTTPNDLADGLEKALSPLNKIKVPVHDIAMTMSIAFRFIPILTEETNKIMQAQRARGADFDEGGLVKKAKGLVPLIVPLILSAINRALDLANAMEARCYGKSEIRTKLKPLKYKTRDFIGYVVVVAAMVVTIVLRQVL